MILWLRLVVILWLRLLILRLVLILLGGGLRLILEMRLWLKKLRLRLHHLRLRREL